jgi:oxygen-independent coproporphyrinogen-3 oxidase
VAGVRWWNVKHPRSYASALSDGRSPAAGREVLDAETRRIERVLLESRLIDGLDVDVLTPTERARVADLAVQGLVIQARNRLTLTLRGRLLADAVVRELLD